MPGHRAVHASDSPQKRPNAHAHNAFHSPSEKEDSARTEGHYWYGLCLRASVSVNEDIPFKFQRAVGKAAQLVVSRCLRVTLLMNPLSAGAAFAHCRHVAISGAAGRNNGRLKREEVSRGRSAPADRSCKLAILPGCARKRLTRGLLDASMMAVRRRGGGRGTSGLL